MRSNPTLLLPLTAFKDPENVDAGKVTQITPDAVTRFAFQKDADGNYSMVAISSQTGPQNDDKVEVIDATYLAVDEIDVTGIDRALVVRLESDDLTDDDIQAIGTAIESYMDRNGCDQFATAAIADIAPGQELFGGWNTLVFTRDYEGKWSARNLGFASVQKSTDGDYGVLLDGKLAQTDGASLVSILLDSAKLDELLDGGHVLDGRKQKHLVRAPIQTGGAYAVVDESGQTIYSDDLDVIASGQTGFLVMPAIDVDGSPLEGQVTTVSGSGETWDVRPGISASKADSLGSAYGAAAA